MRNLERFLSYFFAISLLICLAVIIAGAFSTSSYVDGGILALIIIPIGRVFFCHIYFVNKRFFFLGFCTLFSLILLILSSLGFMQMR